jgi:RNA polymerase sigma-70 factor (ECF subfamily)
MFTVARNAAVDSARARRPPAIGDAPETAGPALQPDAQVGLTMEALRVHAAVDALPPREREVISLVDFGGMSQREVANWLGLPLGTVKTRTRAALALLAERRGRERLVHG